jgi:hypothetical protein
LSGKSRGRDIVIEHNRKQDHQLRRSQPGRLQDFVKMLGHGPRRLSELKAGARFNS